MNNVTNIHGINTADITPEKTIVIIGGIEHTVMQFDIEKGFVYAYTGGYLEPVSTFSSPVDAPADENNRRILALFKIDDITEIKK